MDPDDDGLFLVGRNPDPNSRLPWLIRVPVPGDPVLFACKDRWPAKDRLFCHALRPADWPEQAEVIERAQVVVCARRGPVIDVVLDRPRRRRSVLRVGQHRGGRPVLWWQAAVKPSVKQPRPGLRVPMPTQDGLPLIVVDTREQQPWTFDGKPVRLACRALDAGDYAVWVGRRPGAVVERKSLPDLLASLESGRLFHALSELAGHPRACVVVEASYPDALAWPFGNPDWVGRLVAQAAARYPEVPLVWAGSREHAQEWAYRFLVQASAEAYGEQLVVPTSPAPDLAAAQAEIGQDGLSVAERRMVRQWAAERGVAVGATGRLPRSAVEAFCDATGMPRP